MEENTNVVTTENNAVETTEGRSKVGVAIVLGVATLVGAGVTVGVQKGVKLVKNLKKKHKAKKAAKNNVDDDVVDGEFTEVDEEEFETEE